MLSLVKTPRNAVETRHRTSLRISPQTAILARKSSLSFIHSLLFTCACPRRTHFVTDVWSNRGKTHSRSYLPAQHKLSILFFIVLVLVLVFVLRTFTNGTRRSGRRRPLLWDGVASFRVRDCSFAHEVIAGPVRFA